MEPHRLPSRAGNRLSGADARTRAVPLVPLVPWWPWAVSGRGVLVLLGWTDVTGRAIIAAELP